MNPTPRRPWLLLLLLLSPWLAGCAPPPPELIRRPPAEPLLPAAVQAAPAAHLGRLVRWGGEVVAVHNRADASEIEILARPLWPDGPPRRDAPALGRFLATGTGFIDPAEYAPGRPITVAGRISGSEQRPIGAYPYPYPRLQIEALWLWEPVEAIDPWYGPTPLHDPWWPGRRRCHLSDPYRWCW